MDRGCGRRNRSEVLLALAVVAPGHPAAGGEGGRPALTAAYAVGSGDDNPGHRVDGAFRQTGLQENEARWTGITRFKYYGELLDPELNNLTVVTVGLGLRPTKRSSLDHIRGADPR
jgi:hypothetical protein